jgi:hypothetical protein
VVLSPGHALDDFLAVVEQMGLHKVSYNVGWTAWLDIAPDGVNKATALERVRDLLGRSGMDLLHRSGCFSAYVGIQRRGEFGFSYDICKREDADVAYL